SHIHLVQRPCRPASSTARATGAATDPPVAASARSPPFSTITAMAIFGFCAGAKAMYQACGGVLRGLLPCSAVPVLDAIWYAERPPPAVLLSEAIIRSFSVDATGPVTACPTETGSVLLSSDRSGAWVESTRYGCILVPPLAMVAAITATSSGVTATSR